MDSLMNGVSLPTLNAAIELKRGHPERAIELLQAALPFDFGTYAFEPLVPAYVRGQAYLGLKKGDAAAVEFQKIVAHSGLAANFIFGPLAHLALARAYGLQSDPAKARTEYQDFFALWRDADPDIPILKQAKAEYAKLQ